MAPPCDGPAWFASLVLLVPAGGATSGWLPRAVIPAESRGIPRPGRVPGATEILHPYGQMDARRAPGVPGVRHRGSTPGQGAAQEAGRTRLRQDSVLVRRA